MSAILLSDYLFTLFTWGLILAIFLYLAFVDGLWRLWGRDAWYRWRSAHYRWLRCQELLKRGYEFEEAWERSLDPRSICDGDLLG